MPRLRTRCNFRLINVWSGNLNRHCKRPRQAGKTVVRRVGDYRYILFPDGGDRPLKQWVRQYQCRLRDGFGSHMNGRHKVG